MAIKRDLYVTQKRLDVLIDVTYGTDLIPIEFTIVDCIIPEGTMAVAYAKGASGDIKKLICDISDNVISFTPEVGFFEDGLNQLQIRTTCNNRSLFSYKCKVTCHESFSDDDAKEVESQPTLVEQLLTDVASVNLRAEALENETNELRTIIDGANKRIDGLEDEIADTQNGENTPDFESFDNAEEYEAILDVPTISKGDKMKDILSKITKFCNNIRYLFNFIKVKDIYDAGYASVADAIVKLGNYSGNLKTANDMFIKKNFTDTQTSLSSDGYRIFDFTDKIAIDGYAPIAITKCTCNTTGAAITGMYLGYVECRCLLSSAIVTLSQEILYVKNDWTKE